MNIAPELSRRIVAILDSAAATGRNWPSRIRIGAARLKGLRNGTTHLTQRELASILSELGDSSESTGESKKLLRGLQSLTQAARKDRSTRARQSFT